MKITCDRESLAAAFQTAASFAPSRSPKPILQNIKFVASDSMLSLTATDLEMGIRVEVENVQVEQPGSLVLPVGRAGAILREVSADKIRIEGGADGIVIRADRSQFKLPGMNPDEFPELAEFKNDKYQLVAAKLLKELIRRTAFATDTESSRYALGGLLLEFEPDRIFGIGTDGRRLSKMEGPAQSVNGYSNRDTMTIVPTKSMQLLERVLSDADGEIQICASSNDILVRTPKGVVYSRLVEGRFPRWRDVLPNRADVPRITLTVGPFGAALRQAAVVVSEDSRGIDFAFGEGQLVLSAATSEHGEAKIEMPIDYTGQPVTVRLDNRFVLDFIRVLDPERLFVLELEDAQSPALFQTDDGFGYVVMPLAREED